MRNPTEADGWEGLDRAHSDEPHGGRGTRLKRSASLRGPLRDQGGLPLKKARPEAADPLAKVARRSSETRFRAVALYLPSSLF